MGNLIINTSSSLDVLIELSKTFQHLSIRCKINVKNNLIYFSELLPIKHIWENRILRKKSHFIKIAKSSRRGCSVIHLCVSKCWRQSLPQRFWILVVVTPIFRFPLVGWPSFCWCVCLFGWFGISRQGFFM